MTPDEFRRAVQQILVDDWGETEDFHIQTDGLMENVLIELGYDEGVKLIQGHNRWYA